MLADFWLCCWQLLQVSSFWLVVSFILCGLLHVFLRPEVLQRSLGNSKFSSLLKATLSGMLLPICSCGVVPLALSLYYSGAYLGPTLAFLVATPVINPAALILAFALLGPQIALIYAVTGFILPMLIGIIGNRWGKAELVSPLAAAMAATAAARGDMPSSPAAEPEKAPLGMRLRAGMDWALRSLGLQVSRYVLVGILIAALLLTLIPTAFIQTYLSRPDLISLLGVVLLGAVMYVCAVGHIPFIAALVAAGASPGAAVTFLLAGVATNLPELISIYKLIGKRTVAIYTGVVVGFSLVAGYLVNRLLLPGFMPRFDLSSAQSSIELANKMTLALPAWLEAGCTLVIIAMGLWAWFPVIRDRLRQQIDRRRAA